MSTQRICDLDATPIDPMTDLFYTVTDGRDGRTKDICYECARSDEGVAPWTASTAKVVGDRVHPTAGLDDFAYDVVTAGTTDAATQPTWPTTLNALVTDGTVTYITHKAPNDYASVRNAMPGTTHVGLSLYGWMEGTGEPA